MGNNPVANPTNPPFANPVANPVVTPTNPPVANPIGQPTPKGPKRPKGPKGPKGPRPPPSRNPTANPTSPLASSSIYIASFNLDYRVKGNGRWRPTLRFSMRATDNAMLQGIEISIEYQYQSVVNDTKSCRTNGNGRCNIGLEYFQGSVGSVVVKVLSVSSANYNPELNSPR